MSSAAWLLALALTLPLAGLALVLGRSAPTQSRYWTGALLLTLSPLLIAPLSVLLPGPAQAVFDPLSPFLPALPGTPSGATAPIGVSSSKPMNPFEWMVALWCVGFIVRGGFELRRSNRLAGVMRRANPASKELKDRVAAIAEEMGAGPVRVAFHQGPVFVTGLVRPHVLLNAAIIESPCCDGIIRHELTHIQRGDIASMAVFRALGALLWFNPFWFALEARRRLTAELACDRQALDGASVDSVRLYARALLSAADPHSGSGAVVGFGVAPKRALKMRMTSMLTPAPKPRKALVGLRVSALCLAAVLFGGVQAAQAAGAGGQPVFTEVLLEGRQTSDFGPRITPGGDGPQFHRGHDIAAPVGTPIHAPAGGRVTFAGFGYQGHAAWGYVVLLDHGEGWSTFYAHLEGSSVSEGDNVDAGEAFATVGNTGRSLGPHVHVELRHEDRFLDPADHLPGLARLPD